MLYTKWLILLEETVKFRGSKYVQSNLGDIFTEIKKRKLDEGKLSVLLVEHLAKC